MPDAHTIDSATANALGYAALTALRAGHLDRHLLELDRAVHERARLMREREQEGAQRA